MYNIIVLLMAALAIVLKGRARRKFRRYLRGQIDAQLALLTLAGDTVLGANVQDVLTESAYLTSVKATWSLRSYTVQAGDGPVVVGVAHSDYTDAEILAWVLASNSWEQGNMTAGEIRRRKIRQVGVIVVTGIVTGGVGDAYLNDGKLVTTKCGWQLITGQTLKFWAYNSASGALSTGAVVHVNGHANLWPN